MAKAAFVRPHRPARRATGKRGGKRAASSRPGVPLLHFLGATGTVTGSRFLVETPEARVLVECGLFQGVKALRERNWAPFPVDPVDIDAVVLTHAHLDHSGYLPALVRNGFSGPIFATEGTAALCRILLPDSGHLHEEDAAYANRKGFSKHFPALPLYTEKDALRVMRQFKPAPYGVALEVARGMSAIFTPAGHIFGSATVTIEITRHSGRHILFSGDLGRPHHPILAPPAAPTAADVVLVESTYGDRQHEDVESLSRFEAAINETAERGGVVVIPSFAVDRTEVVLLHLRQLVRDCRIPALPVYVDSPMALATLQIYRRALAGGSEEIQPGLRGERDSFDPGQLIEAHRVEDSIAINQQPGPAIIISASGMATGGRVLHHLAQRLPEPRNTVILVGFQAEGTRGRALLDGADAVKMLGRYVPVRARVIGVPAFSAHADQSEILDWLAKSPRAPEVVYVVHGEPSASQALRTAIIGKLGWAVAVPRHLEHVRLD
jgi:metallo-beta-lactamase family protein